MQALKGFLASKKFWVMLASLVGIPAATSAGMDQKTLMWQVLIAIAYLIAQGLADFGKSAAQAPAPSTVPQAPPAPTPPVLPLLALMVFALSCTPAQAAQTAHEVRTTTDLAADLCKLDPEMQAAAKVKGMSIADVCAGVEALAPFVDSILAAQRSANQTLAARRASCPAAKP